MYSVCLLLAVCSFSGYCGVCWVGVKPRRTQDGQRGDSNFQEIMATVVHTLFPSAPYINLRTA